jgi:hypothetical protein
MFNTAKNFKIPKAFTLFGHRYRVLLCDKLHEEEGNYGTADENRKEIKLQTKAHVFTIEEITSIEGESKRSKEYYSITDEKMIETFYHEMIHIILDSLGEEEISSNETLVNMIGKALLEIYLSSEYSE